MARDFTAELRRHLRQELEGGFMPLEDVVTSALGWFGEEGLPAAVRAAVPRLAAQVLAELRSEQASWPAVTDCDRLDAAFAALESRGIVARQNFTCCQSCGHGEIYDEVEGARGAGRAVRGYAFYHQQDTESAIHYGELYLAYGSTDESLSTADVGERVADALREQGLSVDWDGSDRSRIRVSLDWKRRASVVPVVVAVA